MQLAYDKERNVSQNFNIMEIMHCWIEQNHYPVLFVVLFENAVLIRINNTSETWKYPVTLIKLSNMNFITLKTTLIKSRKMFFYYGLNSKDDWVILNLQQTGK